MDAVLRKYIADVLGADLLQSQPLMEASDACFAPPGSEAIATSDTRGQRYAALQAGLDSLGAVELRSAISSAFGLELPSTFAFDYPTHTAMAAYIVQAMALHGAYPSHAMVRKRTPACMQVAVMESCSHILFS